MKASSAFLTRSPELVSEHRFLSLGEEFAELMRSAGTRLKATRQGEPVEFRRASPNARMVAVSYLEFNLALHKAAIAHGDDLRSTKPLLWRAIKELGLTPPSDLLTYIHDDDVVELYFLDEIQAFRNFRFLEITSYTLDEILCRPWYRNVGRPLSIHLRLLHMVMRLKLGQVTGPIEWNVPEHVSYEKETEGEHRFSMRLKHFIPLFASGKVCAVVSTNHSRLVGGRERGEA